MLCRLGLNCRKCTTLHVNFRMRSLMSLKVNLWRKEYMEYVALKDVCKINMGQSPDSSSYNDKKEGIPFYQGNADFGEKHPIPRVWCNAPTKIAQPEDILMSARGNKSSQRDNINYLQKQRNPRNFNIPWVFSFFLKIYQFLSVANK